MISLKDQPLEIQYPPSSSSSAFNLILPGLEDKHKNSVVSSDLIGGVNWPLLFKEVQHPKARFLAGFLVFLIKNATCMFHVSASLKWGQEVLLALRPSPFSVDVEGVTT